MIGYSPDAFRSCRGYSGSMCPKMKNIHFFFSPFLFAPGQHISNREEWIFGRCGFMLYSELKNKDVINVKDCRKLGRVCDLEFDP